MFRTFTAQWFGYQFGDARTVALVGNAPSIKHGEYGALLDACDVVCRMNQYQLSGYTTYAGSRTDLYISNFLNPKSLEELQRDGVKAIFVSRPLSQQHAYNVALGKMLRNFRVFNSLPIAFADEADFDELYHRLGIPMDDAKGRNPTTGLTALYSLLTKLNIERLLLVGFNFFDPTHPDGVYYFNRDLYEGVTLSELHEIYHPQVAEKQVFRSLIAAHPHVVATREITDLLQLPVTLILEEMGREPR